MIAPPHDIDRSIDDIVSLEPQPYPLTRGEPLDRKRVRGTKQLKKTTLATPERTVVDGRDGFPPPVPGIAPDPSLVPD
jgi:hypothetical protein